MQSPERTRFGILLVAIAISQAVQSQPALHIAGTPSHQPEAAEAFIRSAGSDSSYQKESSRWPHFIAPTAMMAYGIAALKSSALHRVDARVQKEVYANHPHAAFHADDYLIWAPAVTVYGLNAAGIKGEHGLVDRSILYVVSYALARITTSILKKSTHQWRPDNTDFYAFPSGHTTTAFVGAEFLRQEYKGVSPWYGIGGYTTAATAGFLRIYNNKHWLSNTIAGAGLGMASVRLMYWVYPLVRRAVIKDKQRSTIILPSYENGAVGIRLMMVLK